MLSFVEGIGLKPHPLPGYSVWGAGDGASTAPAGDGAGREYQELGHAVLTCED